MTGLMPQSRINQLKLPCTNQGRSSHSFCSNARLAFPVFCFLPSSPHAFVVSIEWRSLALRLLEVLNQLLLAAVADKAPLFLARTQSSHSRTDNANLLPRSIGMEMGRSHRGPAVGPCKKKKRKNCTHCVHGVFFFFWREKQRR